MSLKQDAQLIHHLQQVTGQDAGSIVKILEEVHAWYHRDLPTWIRDRHQELQRQGLSNREIYPRLQAEIRTMLVRPAPLTERQIRRTIYG